MTATVPSTRDVQGLPSAALLDELQPDLRLAALDFLDWLLRATPALTEPVDIVEGVCERLIGLGVPVDRYRTSTTINTADADAYGRTWIRGEGVSETSYVSPGGDDPDFLHSPFHVASTTGRWVDLWLPETADECFGIVPELKAAGYTQYICAPLRTLAGIQGWVTVATKAPQGFTAANRTVLALVIPVLGALISTRIARLTLSRLLRTYVGDEPHRAILDGYVKRGQVTTIRSAILFADMRDSTGHTAHMTAVEAVGLMNEFFDCLVPPIEARGGEVLKYIGDGLLAIFRQNGETARDAASQALAAAEHGCLNISALNRTRAGRRPVDVGLALHYGEAAYGNIGSGSRLDFTVIGRDVGLASRIGGLNARLAEPILMSSAFVAGFGEDCGAPIGSFLVHGFTDPVTVFRPSPATTEALRRCEQDFRR